MKSLQLQFKFQGYTTNNQDKIFYKKHDSNNNIIVLANITVDDILLYDKNNLLKKYLGTSFHYHLCNLTQLSLNSSDSVPAEPIF